MKTADPVDYYSTTMVRQFIAGHLGTAPILWLYPITEYLLPCSSWANWPAGAIRRPSGRASTPFTASDLSTALPF
jgi:hypothetical protein